MVRVIRSTKGFKLRSENVRRPQPGEYNDTDGGDHTIGLMSLFQKAMQIHRVKKSQKNARQKTEQVCREIRVGP